LGPGPGTGDGQPPTDGTIAIRAMRRGVTPGRGEGIGSGLGSGTDRPDAGRALGGPGAPGAGTPQPPVDSTVTIRALRAARRAKDDDSGAESADRTAQPDGTLAIRSQSSPTRTGAPGPARPAPTPPQQIPGQTQQPQQPQQPQQFQQPHRPAPAVGPGPGPTPWAQQPVQRERPFGQDRNDAPDQPVVPWKPPANDPFLAMAEAQTSARPAALGKRFAARLIDTVVLGAIVGAAALPLISKVRTHIDGKIDAAEQSGRTVTVWLLDSTSAGCLGAVLAALLIAGALYEALPTAKWGRTLGKKICGLEVRDIESGQSPSIGAALRRWLLYSVLGVLVVGVVNVLWCLIDKPWRQCWHDKVARTFVAG
ncbi:hypothetical protein QR77_12915, partial [Streptomyces sp. 150FB]|uniref:RDD family protein n=1 Tax=Streptomyces sp. 150FB TaxID=1576605 RepID=UPI0005891EB0